MFLLVKIMENSINASGLIYSEHNIEDVNKNLYNPIFDNVTLSPTETVEDMNVNVNKPWRKIIRRYIDFGRSDNKDLCRQAKTSHLPM